ncbi:MAG: phosphotransferase [Actinomycetota bacterium]|nr:phosphotransferase [Actinomycetota bacterium]
MASLAPLPPGTAWWPGVRDPAGGDLVLHGDLAPWNIVVDGDRWTIIDWDGVAPGRPAWELAYVLHTFVPLWPDSPFDDAEIAHRIAVFAEAYGAGAPLIEEALTLVPARTRALAAATAAGAQAGDPALARLHAGGHTQLWLDAADHVEQRMAAWQPSGPTRSA